MVVTVDTLEERAGESLREQVRASADRVLGRLASRVSRAALSLREHEHRPGSRVQVCSLRLQVPGAGDILVESLRASRDAAIVGALRRARREVVRRRRAPRGSQGWRGQGFPAPA